MTDEATKNDTKDKSPNAGVPRRDPRVGDQELFKLVARDYPADGIQRDYEAMNVSSAGCLFRTTYRDAKGTILRTSETWLPEVKAVDRQVQNDHGGIDKDGMEIRSGFETLPFQN